MHHNAKRSKSKRQGPIKKRKVVVSSPSETSSLSALSDDHSNDGGKGKSKMEEIINLDVDNDTVTKEAAQPEAETHHAVDDDDPDATIMDEKIADGDTDKASIKEDHSPATVEVAKTTVAAIIDTAQILAKLTPLQEVISVSKMKDQVESVKVVNFNEVFDRPVIKRLRILEIVPSCGRCKNLATATPTDYVYGGPSFVHYICDGVTKKPAYFFIIGTCRYSSLFSGDKARQASVTMSDRTYPRAAAFLAAVTRQEIINIPTYQDGISFSTMRDSASSKGLRPASPQKNLRKPPPLRADKNRPLLPWNEDVPAYDGRKAFDLNSYSKLRKYPCEIGRDCAVLIGFTVSTYPVAVKYLDKDVRLSISFNIQFVILLSEPGKALLLPPDEAIGIIPLDHKDDSYEGEGKEEVNEDDASSNEAGPSVWI